MKNIRIKKHETFCYNASKQMWLPLYICRVQKRVFLFFWKTIKVFSYYDRDTAERFAEEYADQLNDERYVEK